MNTVYDIIQALCNWRGYTMKELARLADIPYTTFATMMKKRPAKISVNSLMRIAGVFEQSWNTLLGCEEYLIPTLIGAQNIYSARVSSYVEEVISLKVIKKITGKNLEDLKARHIDTKISVPAKHENFSRIRPRDIHSQFKLCIDIVSDKLNDDGIIEAMRYILELTQNPKYNVSTDSEKKEDTEWQKEEQ